MKSVLISIQPKWCELIASGKKTVEVRKTRPKIDVPFKCYIYQTKKPVSVSFSGTGQHISEYDKTCYYNKRSGKVIGEFVCDEISQQNTKFGVYLINYQTTSGLTAQEVCEYGKGKQVYFWKISDLVIYEQPKELGEFFVLDDKAIKECEHRERIYVNPDSVNGAWLKGSYICTKGEEDWCSKCKTKPITRPPQSWCYVEGVEGK